MLHNVLHHAIIPKNVYTLCWNNDCLIQIDSDYVFVFVFKTKPGSSFVKTQDNVETLLLKWTCMNNKWLVP